MGSDHEKAKATVTVSRNELQEFTATIFHAAGLTLKNASLAAQVLVNADARGVESHGVARLPVYLDRIEKGGSSATAEPVIEREFGAIAVVDGKNALGMITGFFGMENAIRLARIHGIGAVSCHNSGHFGPAAEYARLGPLNDCITISSTNVNTSMAPWGGISPLLGNNPIAIAAPTGADPFILDMALSTVARGKIRLAAARGEEIPLGWGLDSEGTPTTDAKAALDGLITPLGGPKGSALAISVDILCALLSGAATSPDVKSQAFLTDPQDVGHFFLAIYVPAFVDLNDYRNRIDHMLEQIRNSTPAAGVQQIYAPGDIEKLSEERANKEGISLQVSTWKAISEKAAVLNIPMPNSR